MNTETIKEIVIPAISILIAGLGGAVTIYIYYRNSKLRRAEWLHSLFEKFFCQPMYAEIRTLLDYGSDIEIEHLRISLQCHSKIELEEKLVDYLNFFEFISSLWLLRQLPMNEIRMMFDYYIRRLGDYDFIMVYIQNQGFEGLLQLVKKVRSMNEAV